jgi:hypothetical protein
LGAPPVDPLKFLFSGFPASNTPQEGKRSFHCHPIRSQKCHCHLCKTWKETPVWNPSPIPPTPMPAIFILILLLSQISKQTGLGEGLAPPKSPKSPFRGFNLSSARTRHCLRLIVRYLHIKGNYSSEPEK